MRKNSVLFLITGTALVAAWWLAFVRPRAVHGQTKAGYGFAVVPREKGGWDLTGPYQVVPVIKFDLDGNLLYSWGSLGDFPGGLFNMYGASVDQQGNFYIAEVGNGRAQKFRPRPGANPDFLVGKPVYAAWK